MFAVLAACCLLAACGNQRMAAQITELNQVQQRATAQILMLNVLRARVKEPLAYSRLDVLRGSSDLSGGIALNLPFGPNNGGGRAAAPFVTADVGTSNDLTPQDDQDFYRGILTPITPETWALYQDQNWPPDILFHLFVEDIKLPEGDYQKLIYDVRAFCGTNSSVEEVSQQCELFRGIEDRISQLGARCAPIVHLQGGQEIYELSNDPGNRCELWQFEAFTHALLIMGFRISKEETDIAIGPVIANGTKIGTLDWPFKLKDGETKLKAVPGGFQIVQAISSYGVKLTNLPCPGAANVAVAAQSELAAASSKLSTAPRPTADERCPANAAINVAITTRSPDGIVYYLGEVARAAMPIDPRKQPLIVQVFTSSSGAQHPLIGIVKADDSSGDAAARVTFEGADYIVPRGGTDLTMQIFELLQQIFALYNKAPSAPATTAVTVVP